MATRVLSGLGATAAIARVTVTRALRTRSLIGAALVAALPVGLAAILHQTKHDSGIAVYQVATAVAIVIAGLIVAGPIGEEFEDRTMTYLWSRPLPRWSVITGKLAALVPLAALLYAGSLVASFAIMTDDTSRGIGLVVGAAALAMVAMAGLAAAIATLVPRQALALTIAYLFFVDLPIGVIPARIQVLSISFHEAALAGVSHDESAAWAAIGLAAIAALWMMVALWRVRRIE